MMTRCVTLLSLAVALCAPGSSHIHAQSTPPMTLGPSSFFGQFGFDEANDVAVDAAGNVYVAGWTDASGPTGPDGWVIKLTPDASQILYSVALGGSGFDIANALTVTAAGDVYVVGETTSADFPTVNPFQARRNGDSDAWVAKLSSSGAVLYASYYGGSSFEGGSAIAVGPTGSVYVGGTTGSWDLPNATGFQQVFAGGFADGFVLKIDAEGNPVYATYLGGSNDDSVHALAVDGSDRAHITGMTGSFDFPLATPFQDSYGGGTTDAFVATLAADGASLTRSSFLGGTDSDSAIGIALDQTGAAYVTGTTASFDFPTRTAYTPFHSGLNDAFLTKTTADGSALVYSTYFGAEGYDVAEEVAVDAQGVAHISGETDSFSFPLQGAIQEVVIGVDAFYAAFSADGRALLRSTPLGGSSFDVARGLALNAAGDAWIVGRTESTDFPIVNAFQPNPGGGSDAFVSRLTFATEPPANHAPVAAAGSDQLVYTNGCAVSVRLDGSASTDPDGDTLQYAWSGDAFSASGPTATVSLLPGNYPFTLTVDDGRGGTATDTVNVTVIDNVGPDIKSVTATPSVLTPPNHQMHVIAVTVSLNDACNESSTCRIVEIVSSEAANGVGDGDTEHDFEVTGALTARLRAERGQNGRIYSITVECVDAAGNRSKRVVFVTVPR
jgi:PKD domain-containing protein/beta-propeller repeat-containing protein